VTHCCFPNFTADLGSAFNVAIARAMPYLLSIAKHGVTGALDKCPDLAAASKALWCRATSVPDALHGVHP
jgi:hypothetical protein